MKIVLVVFLSLVSIVSLQAQKKGKFGEGFHRLSYYNVHDCKTELQSFDSTITEKKLDNLRSFLYRFGAKDRGIETEFLTFRVYDFTKKSTTPKMLANYSKQQIKKFESSLTKLKKAPIEKEFQALKDELVNNYSKRLQLEKIFSEWYFDQNDKTLRTKILAFYTDEYIIATLDKTLALSEMDKIRYAYTEIYDIVFAKLFGYDRINHIQNKLLIDYKIEIVIDICTKS